MCFINKVNGFLGSLMLLIVIVIEMRSSNSMKLIYLTYI